MAWTAPASPRLLSDIRMTSPLFKHMSNRDFPGGPRLLSEKGQSDEKVVDRGPTAHACGCSSGCARPRPDAGPPRPAERTYRTGPAVPSSGRTTRQPGSLEIVPRLQRSHPPRASVRLRFPADPVAVRLQH